MGISRQEMGLDLCQKGQGSKSCIWESKQKFVPAVECCSWSLRDTVLPTLLQARPEKCSYGVLPLLLSFFLRVCQIQGESLKSNFHRWLLIVWVWLFVPIETVDLMCNNGNHSQLYLEHLKSTRVVKETVWSILSHLNVS